MITFYNRTEKNKDGKYVQVTYFKDTTFLASAHFTIDRAATDEDKQAHRTSTPRSIRPSSPPQIRSRLRCEHRKCKLNGPFPSGACTGHDRILPTLRASAVVDSLVTSCDSERTLAAAKPTFATAPLAATIAAKQSAGFAGGNPLVSARLRHRSIASPARKCCLQSSYRICWR